MKRLFDEKGRTTQDGDRFDEEVCEILEPLIEKWSKEFCIRDLEIVAINEITCICLEKILDRG